MRTLLIVSAVLMATTPAILPAQTILDRLERALDRAIAPQGVQPVPVQPIPVQPVDVRANQSRSRGAHLGIVGETSRDGVHISSVKPGSLAENAGLRLGDVITRINDQPTRSVAELLGVLQVVTTNDLAIQFRRGSQNILVKVPFAEQINPFPALPAIDRVSLGVSVVDITEAVKEQYGVLLRRGAVVSKIAPGSSADKAGVPLGSVIVAVDGRRVDSSNDLVQIIARSRAGQEVELTYYQGTRLTRKIVTLTRAGSVDELPGPIELGPPLATNPLLPTHSPLSTAPSSTDPSSTTDSPPSRPILDALEQAIGQSNQPVGPSEPQAVPQPLEVIRPRETQNAAPIQDTNALLLMEIKKLQEQIAELTKRLEAVESKQPQN